MKRRRSSAPGRLRPDGRWSQSILLAVLVIVLAACGSSTATDEPSASGASVPTSDATAAPVTGTPTEEPTAATDTPTPGPATATAIAPTSSTDPGSARACSGSDQNRDFFASMAAAVDWTVYCPVLPDGWFVKDGQYRLAGGGWMEIGYEGPGDARIVLRQGAFCAAGDGCVPSGREVGETTFGDRTGVLVAGDEGSWSVVVERGATPSWLLVVTGLDEASARTIAADLHAVAS
ncbi:MAG: hypothetical protein Q7S35_06865 [Candidatus Limnocylindrales bacterium]|nr:hypothetical protein [Candidatus Limnocylindrales bacterium]